MVWARRSGSLGSSGFGRPVLTLQNLQRRVHLSPMIMKVAVPLLQHSPRLGQDASSHTVTRVLEFACHATHRVEVVEPAVVGVVAVVGFYAVAEFEVGALFEFVVMQGLQVGGDCLS